MKLDKFVFDFNPWSDISDSHGSDYEDGRLLGCCAV
jgi:hypothetical protein